MSYQFSFNNKEPKKVEAEIPAVTPEPAVEEEKLSPAPIPALQPAPEPAPEPKKGKDKSNNVI